MTTLVHGADETAKAVAASRALFGQGDLAELDANTLAAALAEVPSTTIKASPAGWLRRTAHRRRADGGDHDRVQQVRRRGGPSPEAART